MTVSGLRHAWPWLLLALLLVVVGATYALGGFEKSEDHEVRALAVGDTVTAGPFRLEITGVRTVPDEDDPKELHHLQVAAEVVNTMDLFVGSWLLPDVVMTPTDAGLVPTDEGDLPSAEVRHQADGTMVDQFNPGLTYHVVIDWPQDPAWTGDEVTLGLDPLEWVEKDPWGLDDNRWRPTEQAAFEGTFTVEER